MDRVRSEGQSLTPYKLDSVYTLVSLLPIYVSTFEC